MDMQRAISTLKTAADKNPLIRDVFVALSKRERSWDSISLRPLWNELNDPLPPGKKVYTRQLLGTVFDLIVTTGLGKKAAEFRGSISKVTNLALDVRQLGEAVVGDSRIKNVKRRSREGP
jgi:hypothetical protein